jgi:cytidine deaminase
MSTKLTAAQKERLMSLARKAAEHSYSPYSHFRVGAALLCSNGDIYTGTNVENRSFGLTNCAERSAVFAAVSSGKTAFQGIAVYSPDAEYPIPPCGSCRQVLSEFDSGELLVIMMNRQAAMEKKLSELLPFDSLHELKG